MPSSLLFEVLDVLLPVITKLINLSFELSVFADDLKEALVLPSLKKHGLDIAYKKFRPVSPVSNLRYISKLSEKAVTFQLTDHMTPNKLHLLLQSAYKEHHSTESALLKVKNDILMNMDAQKVTLLVLLDLSAAFDTVLHDILLDRLRTAIGVSGKALECFTSYLSGKSQQVAVNGGLSSSFPLKQGVPQGSCLGPVLLTIYTSKMFKIVEKHLPSVHCYADDTRLYVAFSPNQPGDDEAALKAMSNCLRGRVPFDQNFRKFRLKIEWNRHFPEIRFENFGSPLEVVLFSKKFGNSGNFLFHLSFLPGMNWPQFLWL